jgi:hypothetical protein
MASPLRNVRARSDFGSNTQQPARSGGLVRFRQGLAAKSAVAALASADGSNDR